MDTNAQVSDINFASYSYLCVCHANAPFFSNGFILYFIPTLLLQSLLRVSILPTAAPQSIYYRFHRKQIHTVDLSTSVQVEYISLLHEFFQ